MKKIVLAGGTGHLGRLLTDYFTANGWQVIILSRSVNQKNSAQVTWLQWDGVQIGDWWTGLEGVEAVVNLTGKSIQCRFTPSNRKALYDSRLLPTKVLGEAIKKLKNKPKIWINFSGVSLFNGLEEIQDERSINKGVGFLADLSADWEKVFWEQKIEQVQQVVLRVSPVLTSDSGMFAELLPLVKWGLGGQVADGNQWMNWIHEDDFVRLVNWIVTQDAPSAVYHACSPSPITNKEFMRLFRKSLNVSFGLPLPRFIANVGALMKGVDPSLLLDSVPVTTLVTIEEGFVFEFANAELAIRNLLIN